jgi:hypothetical protein
VEESLAEDKPSNPSVVARLAAASQIARRLSTQSALGFRPEPVSPSDPPDSRTRLLVLDIPALALPSPRLDSKS